MWGRAADELYVVGFGRPGPGTDAHGLFSHFVDGAWADLANPNGKQISYVDGVGDVVWAIGGRDAYRFEAGVVTRMPDVLGSSNAELVAVSVRSASDVWLLGESDLRHWNGATMEEIPLPPVSSPDLVGLYDVLADGPNQAFVVGAWAIDGHDVSLMRWDGATWTAADAPPWLSAFEGFDAGRVGADVFGSVFIDRGDGWRRYAGARVNFFDRAWSDGIDAALVALQGGVLVSGPGRWDELPAFTDAALFGVHRVAADDLWVVGDFGVVGRWDGALWRTPDLGHARHLRAVWGVAGGGDEDVWVGGEAALTHWRDGAFVVHDAILEGREVLDLHGRSRDDVWAACNDARSPTGTARRGPRSISRRDWGSPPRSESAASTRPRPVRGSSITTGRSTGSSTGSGPRSPHARASSMSTSRRRVTSSA